MQSKLSICTTIREKVSSPGHPDGRKLFATGLCRPDGGLVEVAPLSEEQEWALRRAAHRDLGDA